MREPPSTLMACPVMFLEYSEARNAAKCLLRDKRGAGTPEIVPCRPDSRWINVESIGHGLILARCSDWSYSGIQPVSHHVAYLDGETGEIELYRERGLVVLLAA